MRKNPHVCNATTANFQDIILYAKILCFNPHHIFARIFKPLCNRTSVEETNMGKRLSIAADSHSYCRECSWLKSTVWFFVRERKCVRTKTLPPNIIAVVRERNLCDGFEILSPANASRIAGWLSVSSTLIAVRNDCNGRSEVLIFISAASEGWTESIFAHFIKFQNLWFFLGGTLSCLNDVTDRFWWSLPLRSNP